MNQQRFVGLDRAAREAGLWIDAVAGGGFGGSLSGKVGGRAEDYEAVFDRTSRCIRGWLLQHGEERRRAAEHLQRLTDRPLEQQTLFLLNLDLGRGFCLAGLLLESALFEVYRDSREADRRARLAHLVIRRLDVGEYGPSLVSEISCRAWAVWGHVRRIRGRLGLAAEAFHEARKLLRQATGEPLEEGTLLDFEGSFQAAQGRLREAIRGLRRARKCFFEVKDLHSAGRTEVKEGVVALLDGRPSLAAGLLGTGLTRLEPGRDRYAAAVGEALLAALRLESRRLDDRLEAHRRLRRARGHLASPTAAPVAPLIERVTRRFGAGADSPVLSTWPRRL